MSVEPFIPFHLTPNSLLVCLCKNDYCPKKKNCKLYEEKEEKEEE